MITKIEGKLMRVLDEEVRLQVGPFEYQVLVPQFVRQALQNEVGQEIALHTTEYIEGNPTGGKLIPRLIGFRTETELEFFDLFCTVDKVGVRKAMKALGKPVRDIADAIQQENAKWLTTLPGVGAATAEQIVATLKRKVARFALGGSGTSTGPTAPAVNSALYEESFQAMLSLGHSPADARLRLDKVLTPDNTFKTVQDIILAVYQAK